NIKFFYADQRRLMILDRSTQRLSTAVKDGDFLGGLTADGKPFDRSINRFGWRGVDSRFVGFKAEDQGYVRQYIGGGEGAGYLAALTSGHTDHDADAAANGKTAVFLRSRFGLPASLHVLRYPEKSYEPGQAKREGQHIVLAPSLTVQRIDHFN